MRSTQTSILVVLSALALAPSVATAQAALVTGLGGPLDFGTDALVRDDDDASVLLDLTPAFATGIDYFGTRYTELYVNTNGNLSFVAPVPEFTPDEFPHASHPIIAAWWGDVDTRGLIPGEPDRNLVYYALTPGRLVATWIDVGYFDRHVDLLNAFQIILTAAPGEPDGTFDVELRYNRCEWTTGDDTPGGVMGLGGIAAQAGFDAGDGINYLTLPGSRTSEVLNLCTTSNVDLVGVWQLHPRGVSVPATCGNGLRETSEGCDDGDTRPFDGCDERCQRERPCYETYPDGGIFFPLDSFPPSPDASVPDASDEADASADLDADLDANLDDADVDAGEDDADVDASGMDASMPEDASAAPSDAGFLPCPHFDAAVSEDAGPPRPDVGSTPFPDGGRFDSGRQRDGGARTNFLMLSGSGCACRAGMQGDPRGIAALVLVLVLTISRRRRR